MPLARHIGNEIKINVRAFISRRFTKLQRRVRACLLHKKLPSSFACSFKLKFDFVTRSVKENFHMKKFTELKRN